MKKGDLRRKQYRFAPKQVLSCSKRVQLCRKQVPVCCERVQRRINRYPFAPNEYSFAAKPYHFAPRRYGFAANRYQFGSSRYSVAAKRYRSAAKGRAFGANGGAFVAKPSAFRPGVEAKASRSRVFTESHRQPSGEPATQPVSCAESSVIGCREPRKGEVSHVAWQQRKSARALRLFVCKGGLSTLLGAGAPGARSRRCWVTHPIAGEGGRTLALL